MKYEAQVMVGVLFAAFFLVVMNLTAIDRNKKLFDSYCEKSDSLCVEIYRNGRRSLTID